MRAFILTFSLALAPNALASDAPLLPTTCTATAAQQHTSDAAIEAGDAAMRAGKPDQATQHFGEALVATPCSAPAWQRYGSALLASGQHAAAVRALGRAIAIDNADARTWVQMARARQDLGQWEAAGRAYEVALDLMPDLAVARTGLRDVQSKRRTATMAASR
jgi:predicted Zn-dependent protease